MIGKVGRQMVDIAQDALCVALQRGASHRQRDASRMPFEQLGADRRFQIRDSLARGTHGEVRERATLADAAGARDQAEKRQRDEIEPMKVHRWARVCRRSIR